MAQQTEKQRLCRLAGPGGLPTPPSVPDCPTHVDSRTRHHPPSDAPAPAPHKSVHLRPPASSVCPSFSISDPALRLNSSGRAQALAVGILPLLCDAPTSDRLVPDATSLRSRICSAMQRTGTRSPGSDAGNGTIHVPQSASPVIVCVLSCLLHVIVCD